MRVAALYDIHGNLPALEAVIAEVAEASVDLVLVGGDVVPGPMPLECVTTLLDLDLPARFIRGNGEREVLALADGAGSSLPAPVQQALRWTGRQLSEAERRVLASWPLTVSIDLGLRGDVLFCHATPRDDDEILTPLTPHERLQPLFDPVDEPLVVCGHTHVQFERTVGGSRVVNAGSVGMPFGEPGAYWLVIDEEVEWRRTEYDLEAAAALIRETEYPQAAEFAEGSVLRPPREAEMLEALENAAAR